jgi:hypothetical protein
MGVALGTLAQGRKGAPAVDVGRGLTAVCGAYSVADLHGPLALQRMGPRSGVPALG